MTDIDKVKVISELIVNNTHSKSGADNIIPKGIAEKIYAVIDNADLDEFIDKYKNSFNIFGISTDSYFITYNKYTIIRSDGKML